MNFRAIYTLYMNCKLFYELSTIHTCILYPYTYGRVYTYLAQRSQSHIIIQKALLVLA